VIVRAALVLLLFCCNGMICFRSSCAVVTRYLEISTVLLELSFRR
jgi:hypothetical protein